MGATRQMQHSNIFWPPKTLPSCEQIVHNFFKPTGPHFYSSVTTPDGIPQPVGEAFCA